VPIPEFIVALRQHVGHAPLWLPGVTAVVIRDQQVLLVKRSDNLAWTPVTGIVEPGENPADCAVREVLEESGIHVVARRLAWVHVTRPMVHANGDHAQYLDHVFRMDWLTENRSPQTMKASTLAGVISRRCRICLLICVGASSWRVMTASVLPRSSTPAK
jgi:hypothetical protein